MRHLTEEEQNEWLLGGRAAAAEAHLRECADCRSQAESMKNGLAAFRAASLDWSADAARRIRHALPRRPAPRSFAHTWAAGCAAAALAAAVGLAGLHPRHAAPAPNPQASLSDDTLLEQVDRQVAGDVPEAMQPLTGAASTGAASETAVR